MKPYAYEDTTPRHESPRWDGTLSLSDAASVLDREARALAAALQIAGVAPGQRALLFFPGPPGPSLAPVLLGCFYAGVTAVPAPLPPALGYPSNGLLGRLESCQPAIALTTAAFLAPCRAAVSNTGPLEDIPWLVTDAISPASASDWRDVSNPRRPDHDDA
jgi:acyl-CoA synthetase (AMP-forming)/AMP-acid ligase II